MQQLAIGTELQGGKYKILKVLGQGGFGITYLAEQAILNRKVAIKEFFFKDFCERNYKEVFVGTSSASDMVNRFKQKFLKEARTISRLQHDHIIRIYDIFEENNTAYYVMEYIEGCSLEDLVLRNGKLNESAAVDYIKQIASALAYIHQQNVNHLDVKPANIMLRRSDKKTILIDFGVSKRYDLRGGQTSTTPVGISYGYAPMEQYNVGGVCRFSPETDIYSLGATLYRLVTGKVPPQAPEMISNGLPTLPFSLSDNVKDVIIKSMQIKKTDRPKNIDSFLALLNENNDSLYNNRLKRTIDVVNEETEFIDEDSSVSEDLVAEADKIKRKIITPISNIIKRYMYTDTDVGLIGLFFILTFIGCFSVILISFIF